MSEFGVVVSWLPSHLTKPSADVCGTRERDDCILNLLKLVKETLSGVIATVSLFVTLMTSPVQKVICRK